MGSKIKKALPLIAGVGLMAATGGAGGGILAGLKGAGMKKFLMNQAITAALSKATTGSIDPKAQLMAGLMTGVGGMAGAKQTAAKNILNTPSSLNTAAASTNPLISGSANIGSSLSPADLGTKLAIPGRPSLINPALAGSNNLSLAFSEPLKGSANLAKAYNAATAVPTTGASGILQSAGEFLNKGYADPFSLKGAVAYGAPTATAALADAMKTKGTSNDPTAKENEQAQAFYDSATAMNEAMGGTDGAGYDTDTFNKLVGGYLSTMPGNYEKLSGDKATAADDGRAYAQLYPELNYSGLNTFTSNPDRFKKLMGPYNPYVFADGGSVMVNDDPLTRELFGEMMGAQMSDNEPDIETLQGIKDYIDHLNEMDAVKAAMEEQVPNPVGRANGGIMNSGSIPQTSNVPDGMQVDGRGGGFIPMGAQERKDDVPAMLAKNEFVMTADAVRAAGGGSINKGAQKMYDLMNSLEAKA